VSRNKEESRTNLLITMATITDTPVAVTGSPQAILYKNNNYIQTQIYKED